MAPLIDRSIDAGGLRAFERISWGRVHPSTSELSGCWSSCLGPSRRESSLVEAERRSPLSYNTIPDGPPFLLVFFLILLYSAQFLSSKVDRSAKACRSWCLLSIQSIQSIHPPIIFLGRRSCVSAESHQGTLERRKPKPHSINNITVQLYSLPSHTQIHKQISCT